MRPTHDIDERSRHLGRRRPVQRRHGLAAWVRIVAPLTLLGCGAEAAPSQQLYSVLVDARDDRGEPLSELAVASGGVPVGRTDAQGRMRLGVRGRENSLLELEPRCPSSHRLRESATKLRLPASSEAPLEVAVTCEREERVAALLVNAQGFADLPVLVEDRVVGRTDEAGTAHVLLQGTPGTKLRVVLDTSPFPSALPRSPERTFTIGRDDAIEVFDAELTEERRRKRRSKKERARSSHERTRAREH